VKALQALRTMIFAFLNSFVCLLWALVMILIVVYIFAIVFAGAVTAYFGSVDMETHKDEALAVHEHFGSLYSCMISLFCAISGGNDWMAYGQPLRTLGSGDVWFLVFIFYIGVSTIGVMNVVTGIFVDSAVCTRTEDEVVQNWREDQERTSKEVRRIFQAADKDESGELTLEELMEQLENPWVTAYFSGINIDPNEAKIIFTLMDTNNSGSVTIDEFVDGTMKLKGFAKSVDIMAMMFDQAASAVKLNKLASYMEDQIRDIKDVLMPGTEPTARIFLPLDRSIAQQNDFNKGELTRKDTNHEMLGHATDWEEEAGISSTRGSYLEAIQGLKGLVPAHLM